MNTIKKTIRLIREHKGKGNKYQMRTQVEVLITVIDMLKETTIPEKHIPEVDSFLRQIKAENYSMKDVDMFLSDALFLAINPPKTTKTTGHETNKQPVGYY